MTQTTSEKSVSLATKPRIAWIDYAKGFAILLVVLGHVLRGLLNSNIVSNGPAFKFVDSWIYAFHMPFFFLISGLFAERQVERTRNFLQFLKEKLVTLGYPYLLWASIQTLVHAALSGYTNRKAEVGLLFGILFYPPMQFWFIYVLLCISILYWILRRLGLNQPLVLLVWIALFLCPWIPVPGWGPSFLIQISGLYFVLGAWLNSLGTIEKLSQISKERLCGIAIGCYICVGALVCVPPPSVFVLERSTALLGAILGILGTVALGNLMARQNGPEVIRLMGFYSLEIYVSHTLATAGIRIVLQRILKVNDPAIHLVLGTLLGVLFPAALVWFSKKYHCGFMFRLPQPRSQPV